MRPTITPVSYDYESAWLATGASISLIQRAVRAGDLEIHYLVIDGITTSKPVILHAELARWVKSGPTERAA